MHEHSLMRRINRIPSKNGGMTVEVLVLACVECNALLAASYSNLYIHCCCVGEHGEHGTGEVDE